MPAPSATAAAPLAGHEGQVLLSADEALLKGVLESELEIAMISGPRRRPFAGLFETGGDEAVQELLRRHGVQLLSTPHAGRAVSVCRSAARAGQCAVALVPNDQLDHAMGIIGDACRPLPTGAGLALVLEDRFEAAPAACPRQAAFRLDIPTLELADVSELKDSIEQGLRLSRAGRTPVAVIVHDSILRSADTVELGPNRVLDRLDVLVKQRRAAKRRSGRGEAGGVIRTARRLEINRGRCLPNPGERVPVGFLVVGPAEQAIRHLTAVAHLAGRVPVLQLRLINPVDAASVERIARRCEQLVVLEPRPGVVEARVLAVLEHLIPPGDGRATVWGRTLPGPGSDAGLRLGPNEAVHPSSLARKIDHLLRAIRPKLPPVAPRVPPPAIGVSLPPRGTGIGPAAAMKVVRGMIEEVDHWLRTAAPLEERDLPPSGLALDGVASEPAMPRAVVAEVWLPQRFQEEGISALRQASRDNRPWLFVVCDFGTEDEQDLERLARAVAPAERADRVRVELASLADTAGLRELLREAALDERLTVVIVRDGPPARYEVASLDRSMAQIDRLGFEPKQQIVRPADHTSRFRAGEEPTPDERRILSQRVSAAPTFSGESLPRRIPGRFRLIVRPQLERVEIVRTRPPAQLWRAGGDRRLSLPTPLQGGQSQWRIHLAGYRGRPPGPVALAISAAGRRMGYAVRRIDDPAPLAASRRAWAQLLLTNPRTGERGQPLTATVPFGEADLLLGMDPVETLRAIDPQWGLMIGDPDRTCGVVNRGALGDEVLARPVAARLESSCAAVTRDDHLVCEDIAGACRAWFRTDRVTDLVLLGLAFQHGFVPVTLDAMEAGIAAAEARGFGRAMDAFEFGRRLAIDPRLLRRPRTDIVEDADHLVRRCGHLLRRRRFTGAASAERFRRLMRRSLDAMPGLAETQPGRMAIADFARAARRCVVWAGLDYAEQYCTMITSLYRVDRGDRGRAITRSAVLPLAEAMLIREPWYVLTLATDPQQRQQDRRQLNVKPARGDVISNGFLIRLEAVIWRRRVRADVRLGHGTVRAAAAFRRLLPWGVQGNDRERELRQAVIDLVTAAGPGASQDYPRWQRTMGRLHQLAASGLLRGLTELELRRRLDAGEAVTGAVTRFAAEDEATREVVDVEIGDGG